MIRVGRRFARRLPSCSKASPIERSECSFSSRCPMIRIGKDNSIDRRTEEVELTMYYIDPHIHMVSRTTDDYETLAKMGCVGMSEPAFWAGFDRGSVDGFRDYFRQLTEFEPKRAGWYGMQHYTWLCINAKEAENVQLSREVIKMIPEFIGAPGVLGIGEIGLNKNTRNESNRLFSWSTSSWPIGSTSKS